MIDILVIAAFWGMLIYFSLSRSGGIFALLFSSLAFGSFAVVPPEATGGVTFLATPFVVLGMTVWVLRTRGTFSQVMAQATSPNGFLLLTMFTMYAILSAFVLPRLLSGSIYVFAVRADALGLSLVQPSSQNITQSFYLLVSLVLVLVTYMAARLRPMEIFTGAKIGGAVMILTGIVDMAVGNTSLLDPFRTATYTLHTTQTIGGADRIVGLMPEPSSFGSACVALAALIHFMSAGYTVSRLAALTSGLIVTGLVLMAVLSTSSTALVMLAVFGALAIASGAYAFIVNQQTLPRGSVMTSIILAVFSAAAVLFMAAFIPSVVMPIFDTLDQLVFKKVESDSFDERSGWNTAAWNAFLESKGLGVGLGSARASSWPMVIIGNTGVLGSLLFALFLVHILIIRNKAAPILLRNRARGAKLALLVAMTGAILSATSADFGGLIAVSFGMILAWQTRTEYDKDLT